MRWFQPDLRVFCKIYLTLTLSPKHIILILKVHPSVKSIQLLLWLYLISWWVEMRCLSFLKVRNIDIQVLIWQLREVVIACSISRHSIWNIKSILRNQVPAKMHLSWLLELNSWLNLISVINIANFRIVLAHWSVRPLNHLRMYIPQVWDLLLQV